MNSNDLTDACKGIQEKAQTIMNSKEVQDAYQGIKEKAQELMNNKDVQDAMDKGKDLLGGAKDKISSLFSGK